LDLIKILLIVIYLKVSESKFIFMVLYVYNILFATNDIDLLHKTYFNKVVKKFKIKKYSTSPISIQKGDKFSLP